VNGLTISEILFEQFCEENSIQYARIEQEQHKTPDYDVYLGEHLVIAEVKQTDPNEKDEELRERDRSRGIAAGWEKSGRRVRIKIDSAKKQLKLRAQGQDVAILVLYDNVPIGSFDADDIKTAMYGHETVRLDLLGSPEDMSVEIENIGFGSERKFTPRHNTTFSAIALLHKFGGSLRLSVFHNIYAKHPIDPSWLRRDMVRHFTMAINFMEHFKSGKKYNLQTSTNQRPIKRIQRTDFSHRLSASTSKVGAYILDPARTINLNFYDK